MELAFDPFSFMELNRKLHRAELPCRSCRSVNPSDKVTYLSPPLEWPGMLSATAKAGAARMTASSNVVFWFFNVLLLGSVRLI